MLRSEWPLHFEVANDNWWEMATPVRRNLIQSAGQPWMHCQPKHKIHVYRGDDQNHFNNNQTQDNTIIGTLNHNVVQNNGTDSQENVINNSNLNKRIQSKRERERNRVIDSKRHRRKNIKGYRFMERLENRWDEEFPEKTHYSAKGLRSNASRFKKESRKKKDAEIYKIHSKY